MKIIRTITVMLAVGLMSLTAVAQNSGTIKGRVVDIETGESLPQAHIIVVAGGSEMATISDLDGYFTIKPLNPGKYAIKVTYTGYGDLHIEDITVYSGGFSYVDDCKLKSGTTLTTFTVRGDAIIMKDVEIQNVINTQALGQLVDSRNLSKIITAITPGVMASHNERDFSFRGARVGDAAVFVDGIAIRGTEANIPGAAISSVSVITGGLPARYGDTTGGAIVIQTKSYFEYEAQMRMRYGS